MLAAAIAALPEAPADDAAPDAAEALETLAVPAPLPGRQALSETPRIAAMEALFSPALCDYLLAVAAPMLQRALMFDAAIGRSREHPHRRAFAASLPHSLMDLPMLAAQARMAAAADSDIHRAEALAILAYRPGDEYRPHLDCFTEDQGWASAEIAARGQRVATVLTVLNADFQGGATAFPRLGVRWKGAQGGALAFRNVDAAGQADPMTLHAGEPVTAGAKALASLWLRERPVGPDGVPVRQTG
ncbi:MAG: 2OG-Fe(II) oxygenase [Maricaulaceae bacterium]|nr:2OG-Fe(II) oxygenase [Maricaulaceae bacterium]